VRKSERRSSMFATKCRTTVNQVPLEPQKSLECMYRESTPPNLYPKALVGFSTCAVLTVHRSNETPRPRFSSSNTFSTKALLHCPSKCKLAVPHDLLPLSYHTVSNSVLSWGVWSFELNAFPSRTRRWPASTACNLWPFMSGAPPS